MELMKMLYEVAPDKKEICTVYKIQILTSYTEPTESHILAWLDNSNYWVTAPVSKFTPILPEKKNLNEVI